MSTRANVKRAKKSDTNRAKNFRRYMWPVSTSNFFLLFACIGLVASGAYFGFVAEEDHEAGHAAGAPSATRDGNTESTSEAAISPLWVSPEPDSSEARDALEGYRNQVAEFPGDDITPLNLARLGNLHYSEKRDYDQAILSYEILIERYPDWNGLKYVWANLADSYRVIRERDLELHTYERMLEYYPPGTPMHNWASERLTSR